MPPRDRSGMTRYIEACVEDDLETASHLWYERTRDEARSGFCVVYCCGVQMLMDDDIMVCGECDEVLATLAVWRESLGVVTARRVHVATITTNYEGRIE